MSFSATSVSPRRLRRSDIHRRLKPRGAVIDEARTTLLNQGERSATCHPSTEETPLTCELLTQRVLKDSRTKRNREFVPSSNATGVILHTNLGQGAFFPRKSLMLSMRSHRLTARLNTTPNKSHAATENTHVEKLLCELLGVEAGDRRKQ